MAENKGEEVPLLLPCSICCRTFKPEVLEKHARICEKTAAKKRKVFDSSQQRIQGTELAEFLAPVISPKKTEKALSPVRKCDAQLKQKHQEFVRAIRAAKATNESAEHPKRSAVPFTRPLGSEQCPYCERLFGPKSFDRHVDWCKEKSTRIPKSPASVKAKEQLEARTKYRAPVVRSQRAVTREKYSPVVRKASSGKLRDCSPSAAYGSNISLATTVSSVSTISRVSESPAVQRPVRANSAVQVVQRVSVRQRTTSPSKRAPVTSRTKRAVERTLRQAPPVITGEEHVQATRDQPPERERTTVPPPPEDKTGRILHVADSQESFLLRNPALSESCCNPDGEVAEVNSILSSPASRKKLEFKFHQEMEQYKKELKSSHHKTNTPDSNVETAFNRTFNTGRSLSSNIMKKMATIGTDGASCTADKCTSGSENLNQTELNNITKNSEVCGLTVTQMLTHSSDDRVKDLVVSLDKPVGLSEDPAHFHCKQSNNNTNEGIDLEAKKISSWQEVEQGSSIGNTAQSDVSLSGDYSNNVNCGLEHSKSDATFTTIDVLDLTEENLSKSGDDVCNTSDLSEMQGDSSFEQYYEEPQISGVEIDSNDRIQDYLQSIITEDEKNLLDTVEAGDEIHQQEEDCFYLGSGDRQQVVSEVAASKFKKLINSTDVVSSDFASEIGSTVCTSTPIKTKIFESHSNRNFSRECLMEAPVGRVCVVGEDKREMNVKSFKVGEEITKDMLPVGHCDEVICKNSETVEYDLLASEHIINCGKESGDSNEGNDLMSHNVCSEHTDEQICDEFSDGNPDGLCGISQDIPRDKLTRYFFEKHAFLSSSKDDKLFNKKSKSSSEIIDHDEGGRHLDADSIAKPFNPLVGPSPVRKKLRARFQLECKGVTDEEKFMNSELMVPNVNSHIDRTAVCNSLPTVSESADVTRGCRQNTISTHVVTSGSSEEKLEQRVPNFNTTRKLLMNNLNLSSNKNTKHSESAQNLLPKRCKFDRGSASKWCVSSNRSSCESCRSVSDSSDSTGCVHMKLSNFNMLTNSKKQLRIHCSIGRVSLPSICIEDQEDVHQENERDSAITTNGRGKLLTSKEDALGSKIPKPNFWQQHLQHTHQSVMDGSWSEIARKNPNLTKLPPISSGSHSSEGSSVDNYDPYVFAERQMKDLLSHESSHHMPEIGTKPIIRPTPITPVPLATSPTSAFIKYSSPFTLPQPLESESLGPGLMCLPQAADALENLTLLSSPSPASRMRTKYRAKMEKAALSLQQSVSLFRSPVDSSRSETEEELPPVFPSPGSKPIPPPAPYQDASAGEPVDSKRMATNSEEEELFPSEHVSNNTHSAGNKISADSAYSSLNRRSPHVSESRNLELPAADAMDNSLLDAEHWWPSSSESEMSFPQLCSIQVVQREDKSPTQPSASPQSNLSKLSKFCHECGSKYPVAVAKFCCECGVRRLVV